MNYENLFCVLVGGTFGFEFIMSFAAYDTIDTILHHKEKNGFLNLTLFEITLVIFCWPGVLYRKIFDSKKPFYKKTLKEIFFPKRAKAEEVAKKLEKDADNESKI